MREIKLNTKKGVTLVEVLVASIILVISIGGLLYLFSENQKMLIANDKRLVAYKILNTNLEELNRLDDQNTFINYINDNLVKVNTIEIVNGNKEKFTTTLSNYENKNIPTNTVWGITNSHPHLKAVKVMISWGVPVNTISKILIQKPTF